MSFGIFGLHFEKSKPAAAEAAKPVVETPAPAVVPAATPTHVVTPKPLAFEVDSVASAPVAQVVVPTATPITITQTAPEPAVKEPTVATAPVVLSPTVPIPAATTATAAAPAKTENAFERFIDKIGSFFVHEAPVIEGLAVAAEPFLALSPFGPEYDLVVNAIVGVQKTATASIAAGVNLTGAQKMALVLESVTPGLTTILTSKGITSGIPAAIAAFAQNVYNLLAGPSTTVAPTAAATK